MIEKILNNIQFCNPNALDKRIVENKNYPSEYQLIDKISNTVYATIEYSRTFKYSTIFEVHSFSYEKCLFNQYASNLKKFLNEFEDMLNTATMIYNRANNTNYHEFYCQPPYVNTIFFKHFSQQTFIYPFV